MLNLNGTKFVIVACLCVLQISFQLNPMLSARPKLQRQRKLFSKRKGQYYALLYSNQLVLPSKLFRNR